MDFGFGERRNKSKDKKKRRKLPTIRGKSIKIVINI